MEESNFQISRREFLQKFTTAASLVFMPDLSNLTPTFRELPLTFKEGYPLTYAAFYDKNGNHLWHIDYCIKQYNPQTDGDIREFESRYFRAGGNTGELVYLEGENYSGRIPYLSFHSGDDGLGNLYEGEELRQRLDADWSGIRDFSNAQEVSIRRDQINQNMNEFIGSKFRIREENPVREQIFEVIVASYIPYQGVAEFEERDDRQNIIEVVQKYNTKHHNLWENIKSDNVQNLIISTCGLAPEGMPNHQSGARFVLGLRPVITES